MIEIEVLALEEEMNKKRIELAERYCIQNQIRTDILSQKDFMSIYTMLVIKAKNFKKEKVLDKLIKE